MVKLSQHAEFSTHHWCFSDTKTVLVAATVILIFFYTFGNGGTKKDANLLKCHVRITMEEALENQRCPFLNLQ